MWDGFHLASYLYYRRPASGPARVLLNDTNGKGRCSFNFFGGIVDLAEEITEKIGREGLEILVEKAAREGGDEIVEKIVYYGGSYGESAPRAIRRSPVAITHCLEELGAGQARRAIHALNRSPELLTGIVEKYGARALETEIRHPGVGGRLVSLFGEDAVKLGNHLTTGQMIRFARYSDDVTKLGRSRSGKLKLPGCMVRLRIYRFSQPGKNGCFRPPGSR